MLGLCVISILTIRHLNIEKKRKMESQFWVLRDNRSPGMWDAPSQMSKLRHRDDHIGRKWERKA